MGWTLYSMWVEYFRLLSFLILPCLCFLHVHHHPVLLAFNSLSSCCRLTAFLLRQNYPVCVKFFPHAVLRFSFRHSIFKLFHAASFSLSFFRAVTIFNLVVHCLSFFYEARSFLQTLCSPVLVFCTSISFCLPSLS